MNSSDTVRPAHNGPNPSTAEREPSLLSLVNVLLRHRLLIASLALLVGAIWVGVTLAAPRTYSVTTAFVPQGRSSSGALPNFAAQFGINLPVTEATTSPAFYVDLLSSRTVLMRVAQDTFTYRDARGGVIRGSLAGFYGIHARPELARESVIRRLQKEIGAGANIKTGVVTVTVRATQPEIAYQIAQRLLVEVDEYNMKSRQRQAASDRRFAEERLAELRVELRSAEDRLQSFMEQNRNPEAPRLQMQLDRLQRDVAMQQSLYTALAQSYGQAKMEELRDTPVIAMVQLPEIPVLPNKRGVPLKLLIGLLLGSALGAVLAFLMDYLTRTRGAAPDDFEEFSRLRRAAADDLMHFWRPIGRAVRRTPS